ncbi:hypothetical protein GJV85_01950 [Sulfurimonas aquatica]|uniref:Glycosyltransferase RgtA/B/C/D-like domain-containing protein n=1 Tax=Sulfurimonas aquatica TaxID=2672570 RepID=A0A975AYI0_9BACT|nr:hypothetical protein [Sulfurimonas aquatica]QSZ40924.1 hypothetical protein GJV85_01950 [Sulfurimonas aquatica]
MEISNKIKRYEKIILVSFFLLNISIILLGTLHIGGLDDALITYQFAKNLSEHGIISWSAYDSNPIYGSTTFLYTVLLAFFHKVGFDIPATSMLLGSIFWSLSNYFIYKILKNKYDITKALLALLFLTVSTMHVFLSYGMETSLYTLLIILSFYLYSKEKLVLLSWISVLLIMTRLDGILVPTIILIHYFITLGNISLLQGLKNILLSAKYPLIFFVFWLLFLYLYFGGILPNSFQAKNFFGDEVSGVFHISFYFQLLTVAKYPFLMIIFSSIVVIGIVQSFVNILKDKSNLIFVWSFLYIGMFILKHMPHSPWYYAPVLPIFISLFVIVLSSMIEFIHRKVCTSSSFRTYSLSLINILLVVVALGFFTGEVNKTYLHLKNDFLGLNTYKNEERRQMSEIILKDMKEDKKDKVSIYAFEVGYLGYMIPGKVWDLLGLVTPEVVKNGGYKKYSVQLLQNHDIDYVVIVDTVFYQPVTDVLQNKYFNTNYEPIFILPRVFGHNYVVYKKISSLSRTTISKTLTFNEKNIQSNEDAGLLSYTNNSFEMNSVGLDPFLYIKDINFKMANKNFLELKIASSEMGTFEIIFDYGDGFEFQNSLKLNVDSINQPIDYYVRLNSNNQKYIHNIRLDPIDKKANFILYQMTFIASEEKQ